jgi:phosphoadenosine phosphosulfate reductase
MSTETSLKTIQKYSSEFEETVVDFSGGRYSIVLLHLVLRALKRAKVVYIDTTISLPECDRFVQEVCESWGVDLVTIRRKDTDFWGIVKRWGFPHRRFRWCMKEFKSVPLRLFNQAHDGPLHLTGTSKYESSIRKKIYDVRGNFHYNYSIRSFVLHPLLDWTEPMVYDYIEKHHLPLNPCYTRYYGSGNCYYCPFISSFLYYSNLARLQKNLFMKIVEAENQMKKGGGAVYVGQGKVMRLGDVIRNFERGSSRAVMLPECEAKAFKNKLFTCQKRCLM